MFRLAPASPKIVMEESYRIIDQKIAEYRELIRQLDSRRNELVPVSTLSPGLLGRIFILVTTGSGPHDAPTFDFTSWLNFTYVCQKWRNIALDTPTLWIYPDFRYPNWARAMLERSKTADLFVDSDTFRLDPAVMKEVFDNHATHIREIELRGLTSSFLSSILQNTHPSLPRLRSLHLSAHHSREENPDFPIFPAHLLAQSDGLQRLEIHSCALDWLAQPHSHLTHLIVSNARDRPLLPGLVAALRGMPALETIDMVDSLPLATKCIESRLKVKLPRLSALRLSSRGNFFEVLNFLNTLIVPCTTRVYLSCVALAQVVQLPDIGSPLELFFSRMIGGFEKRSFSRLGIYHNAYNFRLSTWGQRSTDLPDLDLDLGLDRKNGQLHELDEFLDKIFPRLHLSDLQTLVLDVMFGQDAIVKYFGQSTTIQNVVLQFDFVVSNFLQVLTHKPEGYEHRESSYYSVTFPALQALYVHQSGFVGSLLEELLDCLMERYERGAGVQKVGFRECRYVGNDDVRLLREIVANVEWDEIA